MIDLKKWQKHEILHYLLDFLIIIALRKNFKCFMFGTQAYCLLEYFLFLLR